jgi:hypothetical protein
MKSKLRLVKKPEESDIAWSRAEISLARITRLAQTQSRKKKEYFS